jgi:hypothetical protein
MTGIEEVRAGIAQANHKADESLAALNQAILSLQEGQQALAAATRGSNQDEIQQALGTLTEAEQCLTGVQGNINATMSTIEGYAARL